jgi:hypothetical protein
MGLMPTLKIHTGSKILGKLLEIYMGPTPHT